MTLSFKTQASLIVCAVLAFPLAQAQTLGKASYQEGKERISANYKTERAACAALTANARDVCVEEGRAKQKVARAELEYRYTGTPRDENRVIVAKAEAAYAVAKEKCDDKAGNAKSVCLKEAKAAEVQVLADAKMAREIGTATTTNVDDKREAQFKLESQKCSGMADDAKSACMTAVMSRFGKT